MKTWKKIISITFIYMLICIMNTVAQPAYELHILNEAVVGTYFEFDIFMLRVGSTPIYLGDCDFKLKFNYGNFNSPSAQMINCGLPGLYTVTPTIITRGYLEWAVHIFTVNIKLPLFSNQIEFDSTIMNVATSENGSLIGRFRITSISNPSGTVGLLWLYPPATDQSVVTSLDTLDPWICSDITSTLPGSYFDSDTVLTSVRETTEIPSRYSLEQNFPNPFNPITVIRYHLPKNCHVSLKVFDILGREIAILVNEVKTAGNYYITWNASTLPSGIYFYRILAGNFSQTRKMLMTK